MAQEVPFRTSLGFSSQRRLVDHDILNELSM
jgi:hypothetical protein